MSNLKKKKRSGNEGFSLVEVLCAVVLLAIIAAPVLQMFYSSYTLNQRSKKYLAASDLAQTILEGVSEQTWDKSDSVKGDTVYPGLKDYYENNLAGYVYKNPISGAKGPRYSSYSSTWENDAGAIMPQMVQNTCEVFYFTGVETDHDPTDDSYFKDPFYVKLIFDTSHPSSAEYYSLKVTVKVYSYEKKGVVPVFNNANLSNFTLIQTASTKVPNKR